VYDYPQCGAVPEGPFYLVLIPKMIVAAGPLVTMTLFFFRASRRIEKSGLCSFFVDGRGYYGARLFGLRASVDGSSCT
jgi:hypothetical protein